jgi:hypothetical protein
MSPINHFKGTWQRDRFLITVFWINWFGRGPLHNVKAFAIFDSNSQRC